MRARLRVRIVADESPLHLYSLIPQCEARVRKSGHTREPVSSSTKVTPEASFSPGTAHRHQWTAKGQGRRKGRTTINGPPKDKALVSRHIVPLVLTLE